MTYCRLMAKYSKYSCITYASIKLPVYAMSHCHKAELLQITSSLLNKDLVYRKIVIIITIKINK